MSLHASDRTLTMGDPERHGRRSLKALLQRFEHSWQHGTVGREQAEDEGHGHEQHSEIAHAS